jgi:hypothetical protein
VKKAERPQWQQDVLKRAFDAACAVADGSTPPLEEPRDIASMTDEQVIVSAYFIMLADLGAVFEAVKFDPDRPGQRCGWCVNAAGNDQAAWDNAVEHDGYDAITAHTTTCEHNPLVRDLQRLHDEHMRFILANADLGMRVLELQEQLAQRDATIRNLYETSNA